MARKERLEAEVEFKAKGLKKLRGQWLDFAGDLAEPMILLAGGATKAQAAWAGLKGVFEMRVLGPMGMVAGAATALLGVTNKLVGRWKDMGMASAAALSRMTLEFRPLLGSMELANKRVKELYEFTAKTPFRLAEVAAANKTLETLTQGALSGKDGMELVGDSAAVAGVRFDEAARSVGRLYDGLMSGRPVGEASMRLQEMGLISGKTRNAIEAMQAANVSGLEIWKMVNTELASNKGAMKDLSQELEGLQSTLADVREQTGAGFSKGFMEGEKASVEAATKMWEKLRPVAEYVGRQLGTLSNWWEKLKARMLGAVSGGEAVTGVLKVLANAFMVLTSAVVLAAGAAMGRFVAGVIATTAAQKAQIVTMGADTAAKGVNTAVTRLLAAANGNLAQAYLLARGGSFRLAAAQVKLAASNTLAAFRTGGLAAATGVLSGALKLTGKAVMFVTGQIRVMMASLVANPIMRVVTALIAAGAALLHYANKWADAAKASENYRKASEDVVKSLKNQRSAIETVVDLRKHEADVLKRLGNAYREEADARRRGSLEDMNTAQNKIIALRKEVAETNRLTAARLRKNSADMEDDERKYREGKDVKEMRRAQELEDAGADEKVAILGKRLEEAREKQKKALADEAAEKRTDAGVDAVGRKGGADIEKLRVEVAELEAKREELEGKAKEPGFWKKGFEVGSQRVDRDVARAKLAAGGLEKELEAKRKELADMEAERSSGAQMDVAAGSDSEIARLEAKLALHKRVQAARKAEDDAAANLDKAREQQDEAEDDGSKKDRRSAARDVEKARLALEKARREKEALEKVDRKRGGFASADPAVVQAAETRVKRLREERADDASGKNVEEARRAFEKARKDREDEVARVRLDAEAAVSRLRDRGMEAEKRSLEIAREKLELERQRVPMADAEYEAQKKILAAREAAMNKNAMERGQSMVASLQERRLRRQGEMAREDGDQKRAKRLEKEADAVRDAQRRKRLEKEAGEVSSDPAHVKKYVDAVMAEEKAQRQRGRKREAEDDARERERVRVRGDGGLGAEYLRMQGRGGDAARLDEARERKLDEIRREELKRKYREDGFGGEEADNLANRDIKVGQAQRAMDMLKAEAGGSSVVASSLAKIGGGGGVSGRDPNTRLLEQMRELLKDIRDQEKENVMEIR